MLLTIGVNAQDSKSRVLGKDENMFIRFDKEKTSVFVNPKNYSNVSILKETNTYPSKKNFVNVYVEWQNPLKYSIVHKDSVYTNRKDEVIRKYIKELSSILPIDQSTVGEGTPKAGEGTSKAGRKAVKGKTCKVKFENRHLLYYKDRLGKKINPETSEICKYSQTLDTIEEYKLIKELSIIHEFLDKVFNVKDYESFTELENSIGLALSKYKNIKEEILFNIKTAEKSNQQIFGSKSDKLIKLRVDDFLNEQRGIIANIDKYIFRLGELCLIVKNHKPKLSIQNIDYVLLKNIRFESDKEVQVNIKQKENKLETKDYKISEESVLFDQDFIVNKYDFFNPTIATGIFYSNTNLRSFGVTTNDNGELIISEDIIDKNQAVTGLFLNLNLNINSRFLEPVLQLGIDPTKKKPFLLLGGGFAIPTSNFAITGGPIWTWEAELDGISIGDRIESTTELESKVNYEFNIKPKGYYLGLIYTL